MPNFIQGFLAVLTLDGVDITLTVEGFDYSESRTSLDKSVMDGSGESPSIPGKRSGTLSITGHIAQDEWNSIETTFQKDTPVSFVFEPAQNDISDFEYSGEINLTGKNITVAAGDNWGFVISGDTFDVVYTPHVSA
jgi:hypothetical protein